MALSLSYSGAMSWRSCEQQYWYRYVDGLRPKSRSAPLELGNWLHSYMERYFKAVQRGINADDAHEFALTKTREQYDEPVKALVATSLMLKQDELAAEIDAIPQIGSRIAQRYFESRGREDSERYEIILVEYSLNVEIEEGVRAPGIIDLVVRDLDRGILQMWDHKSTGNVPDRGSHTLDMQEVLYAAMLDETRGIEVEELVWNYLRTKEPTVPETLKAGGLSKAKNIDTDAQTYKQAILENGLNVEDYSEVLSRLAGRDQSVFFPRHVIPLFPDSETVIVGDFIRTSQDIQAAKGNPDFRPLRNIGRGCNWCDFRKLCEAVVTGGDTADLIVRNFEQK